jgi:fumarate hydratase subunit beta
MKKIILKTPVRKEDIVKLKVGQMVYINGIIYTARDQAHKRFVELLHSSKKVPVDLKGQIIYYTGPTPKKGSLAIGSCGPTTSSRMDKFTPEILKAGVKVLMGKGQRSEEVQKLIKKYRALYLVAPAGCGAYLADKVKEATVKLFEDLGPEAVYRLKVVDFPAIVCIDAKGENLYSHK